MPGKRSRSSGGSTPRTPAAQAPAAPKPKPEAKPAAAKVTVTVFTTPLTGLRVLLPEGTVQFMDGRFETASDQVAAALEQAAASNLNLAIRKEN